ncbi:hypothetical protein ABW19_dt0206186 [Dactylella cylindrospora]|nr:hypothetical protein ABW19_dt0206186 [Dactylella cylindrospora]
MNIPFEHQVPFVPLPETHVLRPSNRHNQRGLHPASKIQPSVPLANCLNLPKPGVGPSFQVYGGDQTIARQFLDEKELVDGNRIKLCVGVDQSVTKSLRLSKEDVVRNRALLKEREEYTLRHTEQERLSWSIYEKVREIAIKMLNQPENYVVWPFVMVYSCYEFTSMRRDFQHGHCLYLMLSLKSSESEDAMRKLRRSLTVAINTYGGKGILDLIIHEISHWGPLNDSPRLLESNQGRHLPRNFDYHVRPPMGSSIGPAENGVCGTLGGYVVSKSGVFALTASHAVGKVGQSVVSPSTVDLGNCYRHARVKEELCLHDLDINIRTIGESTETVDSRRRWELAQEELLTYENLRTTSGLSSHFGTVVRAVEATSLHGMYEGYEAKTYVDLAVISCDASREGFNIIPCVEADGRSTLVEVSGARSPIYGEPVIKNSRSSGLTHGRVLSVLAWVGVFEEEVVVSSGNGNQTRVVPKVITNWCITSDFSCGNSSIFAEPGDSGAWVLAKPSVDDSPEDFRMRKTPVIGSIMHGFTSADGIDLVMFQPWESVARVFQLLLGESCVPALPLSYRYQQLRDTQGNSTCAICLRKQTASHFIEDCPERFVLDRNRHEQRTHRLSRIPLQAPGDE